MAPGPARAADLVPANGERSLARFFERQGVEVEIDLTDLAPDAQRMSRRHSALGRIRYPATATAPAEVACRLRSSKCPQR